MNEPGLTTELDSEATDRSAILMMLAYVAAECRRLGSEEAARHASLAATLVQGETFRAAADCVIAAENQRRAPVH